MDMFDLERFVSAQDANGSYATALKEIKEGQKWSHWLWHVFPQIRGLGRSRMSQQYSIKSLLEAKAYLEHPVLGQRMYEVMNALPVFGDAEWIFGQEDAMKLQSCLTLFDIVSPQEIFADFLGNYFEGERCPKTLEIVADELSNYKGKSAFVRNGVHAPAKAFFEFGSDESNQLTLEQELGTLLDLLRRGETLRRLLSRYLWDKDFSFYRVSGVKYTLCFDLRELAKMILEHVRDEKLLEDMNATYDQVMQWEDGQVLMVADTFDGLIGKYRRDLRVQPVFDTLLKESLCKPMELKDRFYHGKVRPAYTPDKISSLKEDEIFVFGSNLHGRHGGGAARVAQMKFGAIWGQGTGLQGQSYAIPTMQGGVETIRPYVDQFIDFAKEHPALFFYVTRIGCGIAGFSDREIAPLFRDALAVDNICLPESFVKVLVE